MWEKLNNSSLLFSKTFIQNKNKCSVYSNRVFFHRMYFYFVNKGYFNIILNSIINLLVSNFLVFFLLFLIKCVDYDGLLKMNSEKNLAEFVNFSNLLHLNIFFVGLIILFILLDIVKIISLIDDIYIFKNIRKFYRNNLKIKDSELEHYKWNDIIHIYKDTENEEVNPYYINSIITSKDNYFTALIDSKTIRPIYLNDLFEWNLIFCIIYGIFNNREQISEELLTDPQLIEKSMKIRLKIISLIYLLCMPILIVFITIYNIFTYGEQFYNQPDMLISRNFTKLSEWQFRNYNEPNHKFRDRMINIQKLTNKYSSAFNNKIIAALLKFIIFVFSAIFITLLCITLINDSILTNLNIVGGKNVLWFMGVTGSIIAIIRTNLKSKNNDNPLDIMEKLSNYIIIDKKTIDNANMSIIKKKFLYNYRYKILLILQDIFSIIIMPIQLWSISYDTAYITMFLKKITTKNNKIGYICKYADFETNYFDYFGSIINEKEKDYIVKKIGFSEELLTMDYPQWQSNITMSTQINVV